MRDTLLLNYDTSRVTELPGGIEDILRTDFKNINSITQTQKEIIQRATNHVDIDPDAWHKSMIDTLKKVLVLISLSDDDTLVYPWRAALAFYEAGLEINLPQNILHAHFRISRDETDPKNNPPLIHLPFGETITEQIRERTGKIITLDPMVATGGSIDFTINQIDPEKTIKQTRFHTACLVAAPEGIISLQNAYPEMHTFAGVVDEKLDENCFIQPGLGDAGDKYMASLLANKTARNKILNSLPKREKQELEKVFDNLSKTL